MQPQTAQNNGFTQIYNKDWKRIVELSGNNKSSPIGLYAFFANFGCFPQFKRETIEGYNISIISSKF